MLIGTVAFANTSILDCKENDPKIEISIKNIDTTNQVSLEFKSIDSFNDFNLNQLTEIPLFNVNDVCTVNISVTVSIGLVSITMGAQGVPCSDVKSKIKELLAFAREAIMS